MYTIDERIRGFPASREQVASLHQSINTPHLAVPGKQAGPARAYILGLRSSGGYAVFVYLYLSQAQDCAVYVSPRRNLPADQLANEETEAIAFVESMGFMMDNANFRGLPQPQQEELMKSLPVFQKDPKTGPAAQAAKKAETKPNPTVTLGKIFSAF
ncbi:MAG: social motility and stimulation tgl protein [Myxococcaceae bacterium]